MNSARQKTNYRKPIKPKAFPLKIIKKIDEHLVIIYKKPTMKVLIILVLIIPISADS